MGAQACGQLCCPQAQRPSYRVAIGLLPVLGGTTFPVLWLVEGDHFSSAGGTTFPVDKSASPQDFVDNTSLLLPSSTSLLASIKLRK
jgi:hypothetical protein